MSDDPLPSSPQKLLPQQRTDLSVRVVHVWAPPAEMPLAVEMPVTLTGTSESVVVLLPSCP